MIASDKKCDVVSQKDFHPLLHTCSAQRAPQTNLGHAHTAHALVTARDGDVGALLCQTDDTQRRLHFRFVTLHFVKLSLQRVGPVFFFLQRFIVFMFYFSVGGWVEEGANVG